MPSHSRYARRRVDRPAESPGASQQEARARGVSVEEGFVADVDELPTPAGFGVESSTSTQSSQLLASYEVPAGTLARLREVSLTLEGNGQGRISVAGTEYGPFTGSVALTVPLEPGVLTQGYQVRVHFQSTDGASTTARSTLSVLEV